MRGRGPIYAGKRVVGFLMYDVPDADDDDRVASIYRFMIDRKHQGKGYGRAALAKALEEIKAIAGHQKDLDLLRARKSGGEAVLRQLRLRGDRPRRGSTRSIAELAL